MRSAPDTIQLSGRIERLVSPYCARVISGHTVLESLCDYGSTAVCVLPWIPAPQQPHNTLSGTDFGPRKWYNAFQFPDTELGFCTRLSVSSSRQEECVLKVDFCAMVGPLRMCFN